MHDLCNTIIDMSRAQSGYKYRYQVAEEVLRDNGSDAEVQRRIMQEFPNSRENPTRAQWYRRSFEKYNHCRGNHPRRSKVGRPPIPKHETKGRIIPVRFTMDDLRAIEEAAKADKQTVSEWIRNIVHRLLADLAASNHSQGSRSNESRQIRKDLRSLGHRGGIKAL